MKRFSCDVKELGKGSFVHQVPNGPMARHASRNGLKPARSLVRLVGSLSINRRAFTYVVHKCVPESRAARQAEIQERTGQRMQAIRCIRFLVLVLAPVVLGWAVSPDPSRDRLKAGTGQKRPGQFLEGLPVALDPVLEQVGRSGGVSKGVANTGGDEIFQCLISGRRSLYAVSRRKWLTLEISGRECRQDGPHAVPPLRCSGRTLARAVYRML